MSSEINTLIISTKGIILKYFAKKKSDEVQL